MEELRLEVPPPAELVAADLRTLAVLPDGTGAGAAVGFWDALTDWAHPERANFARCIHSTDLTVVFSMWRVPAHVVELDDDGEVQLTQESELPVELQTRVVAMLAGMERLDAVKTSHFYPLFQVLGDPSELMLQFAAEVRLLPVGVGTMGQTVGLVLTSSGADYTLALAEAYVRIGYLPPHELAFAPIPEPKTQNERIARLAILRSAHVHTNRLRSALKTFTSVDMSTAEFEQVTR
jgi:hypothetical protein